MYSIQFNSFQLPFFAFSSAVVPNCSSSSFNTTHVLDHYIHGHMHILCNFNNVHVHVYDDAINLCKNKLILFVHICASCVCLYVWNVRFPELLVILLCFFYHELRVLSDHWFVQTASQVHMHVTSQAQRVLKLSCNVGHVDSHAPMCSTSYAEIDAVPIWNGCHCIWYRTLLSS